MLRFWEHPLSPYAQKVKIAMREKGVAFEAITPMGIGSGAALEEFAKASPFGEVPVMVLQDGFSIFDSTIMLEYLEEAYPKPDMLPEDPKLAAKARMIEEMMDTRYEAPLWAMGEIHAFKRAEGEKAKALEAEAARQIAGLNAWLARELGDHTWFCPPHFGWADLSVVPYLASATARGMGPAKGTPLSEWLARAMDRPAVSQTLEEARASVKGLELAANAVKSGLFKRQYRDHRLEWMVRSGGVEIVLDGLKNNNIRFTPDIA